MYDSRFRSALPQRSEVICDLLSSQHHQWNQLSLFVFIVHCDDDENHWNTHWNKAICKCMHCYMCTLKQPSIGHKIVKFCTRGANGRVRVRHGGVAIMLHISWQSASAMWYLIVGIVCISQAPRNQQYSDELILPVQVDASALPNFHQVTDDYPTGMLNNPYQCMHWIKSYF